MNLVERIRLLISLVRPPVAMLLGLFACAAMAEAGGPPDRASLAAVLVAVIGFLVAAVVVNDLADAEIDRVNLQGAGGRPLVEGRADRGEMVTIAITGAVASLTAAATLGRAATIVVIGGLLLAMAYSVRPVRLADRGALASMLLPAGYVAVPFLLGLAAVDAPLTWRPAAVLGALYLGFIGRILLKDFRDVRGDALFGKRTFLVRHGRRATCALSACFWVAGTLVLPAVRDVSLGMVMAHLAMTATVVVLLGSLAGSSSPRTDEAIVAAIAIVGRGAVATLIAHWSAVDAGWSGQWSGLLCVALAVLTLGQANTMARFGPQSRLWMPAAWPASYADDSPVSGGGGGGGVVVFDDEDAESVEVGGGAESGGG